MSLHIDTFYHFFLIVARCAGMMFFMPFISDTPGAFRIIVVLGLSYCVSFLISQPDLAALSLLTLGCRLIQEICIGVFLGIVVKLCVSVFEVTGMIISTQIGLSGATVFNPMMPTNTLLSYTLMLFGYAIFFQFNLHHLVIKGFVHSYTVFPHTLSDMTQSFMQLLSKTMLLGVQLATPFIIIFLLMQMGLGFVNRIIPQMHIFLVSVPVQLWLGLFVLMVTGGIMLESFVNFFTSLYVTS